MHISSKAMILGQFPFYALAARRVFRRHGLNFAEQLTLQTFITAYFITRNSGGSLPGIMAFITASYQVFSHVQFFKAFTFKALLKAIGVNIPGMDFFVLFVSVILLIIGVATNAFKLFRTKS